MEPAGVILLDHHLEVQAMNEVAAAIWNNPSGAGLQNLVTGLSGNGHQVGRLSRLDRGPGAAPYLVWITRLGGAAGKSFHVVTVFDPEAGQERSRQGVLAAYRFTKAEVRLVDQLLQGRTPLEAAKELGVTIHTVRTYLKRLYAKVGVRSQAMLVRRLLQLAGAMTAGSGD